MSHLTPTAAWPAAALFLASGTWWLASMSLQASSGFSGAPVISAQAAFALVLGQWIFVSLFASHNGSQGSSATIIASLSFVVPLWPLFALLWLTSELSIETLVQTQLIACTLAAVLTMVGSRVEQTNIDHEYQLLLQSAVGITAAALIWTGRGQIFIWVAA